MSTTQKGSSARCAVVLWLGSDLSVFDIENLCGGGNRCFLNLINDPFFFGKGAALDSRIIQNLERIEFLIRERRMQLQKLSHLLSSGFENKVLLRDLSPGDGLCGGGPSEIVEEKRGGGGAEPLGAGEKHRDSDGIDRADIVNRQCHGQRAQKCVEGKPVFDGPAIAGKEELDFGLATVDGGAARGAQAACRGVLNGAVKDESGHGFLSLPNDCDQTRARKKLS
jgi:hypothetical protein